MSVDTNGCVITKNKDAFIVAHTIENWWNGVRKANGLTAKDYWKESPEWVHPKIELRGYLQCLSIFFKYKGENRRLFVTFDCDTDLDNYKDEIKGDSCLWFRFGCWGSSVELMESLLNEFKKQEWVERCYIDQNDSDEHGFKEV